MTPATAGHIRAAVLAAAFSAVLLTKPAFAWRDNPTDNRHAPAAHLLNGSPVDTRHGPYGATTLMVNAAEGESLMLLRLLEAGADPNIEDFTGRNPLDYAVEARQAETGRLLVSAMQAAGSSSATEKSSVKGHTGPAGTDTAGVYPEPVVDSPEARRLDAKFRGLVEQGRYDEALQAAGRLLDERRRTLGGDTPLTAEAYDNIGDVSLMRGDAAGAEGSYLRALGIREKALGPGHSETRSTSGKLMSLYSSLGQGDKAEAFRPETSGEASGAGSSGGLDSLKKSFAPALKPFLIVFFGGLAGIAAYKSRLIPAILGIGDSRQKNARRAFDAKRLCDSARREERTGNLGGAALLYERSLRLNPEDSATRFRLARIYQLRLKDMVSARKHYRTLVRTLPQTDGLRREALRCLGELGDKPDGKAQ